MIQHRVEKDRFQNDVSLIALATGERYRMVHFTPRLVAVQRALIFAARGVFVRVRTFTPDRDNVATTMQIGGYECSWGDGDALMPTCHPAWPDLKAALGGIHDDDFTAVIITVLQAIRQRPDLWERRQASAA